MTSIRLINLLFILSLTLKGCSGKPTGPDDLLFSDKIIKEPTEFVVIDLDRCNSCFMDHGENINSKIKSSESIVIILSNSQKKADLFGIGNKLNYIWDSTRYFDKYLENSSIYFHP